MALLRSLDLKWCSLALLLWAGLGGMAISSAISQEPIAPLPMQPVQENGAEFRWLNKPVLNSRLLDGMEDISNWSLKGEGEISLATEHVKDGAHSLQMRSTWNPSHIIDSDEWLDLIATRHFPSEDWRAFNRISVWIYPEINGAPAISAKLTLHNEGAHLLPDSANEGRHESIPLKNREWNHVVWEIAPLDRDRITALEIGYTLPKMYPDPGDKTVLYIGQLALEAVVPDHVEGWDVSPDHIAFSHSGYISGATKTAIASDLKAPRFSLVNSATGEIVLTKYVEQKKTSLGSYQVLDFSEVHQPGQYVLRSGAVTTRSFRIGDDAWRDSILKAVNFMYGERCGTVIPGIHGICHQDDYSTHNDKRIIVNGGYHDAGDLSATGNTPGMSYALFELAERLNRQNEDPALAQRVLEEAKWGLRWVLKTSFGDGYRSTGQLIAYWTNGIIGDADDRHGEAVNNPEWNFRVAAVEAIAARVLHDSDSELANRSLATAEQDWGFAMEGLKSAAPLPEVYGQSDELERISFGAIASVDLYKVTGDRRYADAAIELADKIMASQERAMQPWNIPMTGFFYTSPARENLFHRFHIGQEEEPVVALTHLCEALPDDPHWINWYSAVVLHTKYYQQAVVSATAPFNMLPAGIYRESDVQLLPQSKSWTPLRMADHDVFLGQVHQGIPLGGEYYLRRFPVWFDFRGNSSVLLSQAKALSAASQLRNDMEGENLAQDQAQWFVGRNPFSSSIMYGEGYDWTPLYSGRSGQLVGALPVGIETRGNADAPYWPTQICWTYKEVWTQPVGEWIWLMRDLSGPAVIEGEVDPGGSAPVQIVDQTAKTVRTAALEEPGNRFRIALPQGRYTIRRGLEHVTLTVLSAGLYRADLRHGHAVDVSASSQADGEHGVLLRLTAEGSGAHQFAVRANNLELEGPATQQVNVDEHPSQQIEWRAHIIDPHTPWVAVIVQDKDIDKRVELTGVSDH